MKFVIGSTEVEEELSVLLTDRKDTLNLNTTASGIDSGNLLTAISGHTDIQIKLLLVATHDRNLDTETDKGILLFVFLHTCIARDSSAYAYFTLNHNVEY